MLALTKRRNHNTAATADLRVVRSQPVSATARVGRAIMEHLEIQSAAVVVGDETH